MIHNDHPSTPDARAESAAVLPRWVVGLTSLVLASLIWWMLTGGNAASWVVGVPVVTAVVWSAWRLRGGDVTRISLPGLLRFIPFFIWESIRGGVDVASRVLRPRMTIQPGFVSYSSGLRTPAARLLFLNCISLLPGTLAADIADSEVRIHTLDLQGETGKELSRLEHRVAAVFGEQL
ncbi:MAG: Na+/H+ antiporter subunit E [Candidatus Thiodiazotropha sp.]